MDALTLAFHAEPIAALSLLIAALSLAVAVATAGLSAFHQRKAEKRAVAAEERSEETLRLNQRADQRAEEAEQRAAAAEERAETAEVSAAQRAKRAEERETETLELVRRADLRAEESEARATVADARAAAAEDRAKEAERRASLDYELRSQLHEEEARAHLLMSHVLEGLPEVRSDGGESVAQELFGHAPAIDWRSVAGRPRVLHAGDGLDIQPDMDLDRRAVLRMARMFPAVAFARVVAGFDAEAARSGLAAAVIVDQMPTSEYRVEVVFGWTGESA